MNILKWIKNNTSTLEGKTVAISGATGGIGRELCNYFASLGASLVLLDRNIERSVALANKLRDKFPSLSVSHIIVDMADMKTVKLAGDELSKMTIDILVLNAGAYSIPRYTCDTGYDNVFQINFVSPYYLARKLMPNIRSRRGKIVAVGSIAHNYSHIDMNDIDFSTRRKASLVYGNAKRYLMFSMYELSQGPEDIAVVHPGITFTNITAHYPKIIFAIIKYPMKIIFMPPRKAALSIVKGIFTDCLKNEWIGPSFFNVWGKPKLKKLKTCSEDEAKHICREADIIYERMEKDI